MRFYDFECPRCGKVVIDHPRDFCDCSECEVGFDIPAVAMWKRPSAPALAFKGPGWTPKFHGGKS